MAATALGCSSRKEFCARFRSANPHTLCDLDPLNKWMQGRSLPRGSSIYADLATVIGTANTGRWVAECSIEEFAAELVARTGVDPAMLAVPARPARRAHARPAGLMGGVASLAGAFASYSPAWSPHSRGHLVRGSLLLTAGRNDILVATYTESLVGQNLRLTGEAKIGGRAMTVLAQDPQGQVPLFMSLHVPGPPASVLCGVMSGFAFVAHETLPSASRIVSIRVHDASRLDGTNRYLDPVPGAVAADLLDLGISLAEAQRLDAFTRDFLGKGPDQATTHDQATFAGMLDREHLNLAG